MAAKQDSKRKLLVCGYIRNLEKVLEIENIPEDIRNIIYLFQQFCDEWDAEYSHPDIKINEDKSSFIVSKDGHRYRTPTAYGRAVISSGIYRWRIKIEKSTVDKRREGPYIGIIENDTAYLRAYISSASWDNDGYQLLGQNGVPYRMGLPCNNHARIEWYKEGDVLEIILDLDACSLTFIADYQDSAVHIKIIKSEYRLAITMDTHPGAKIALL